ncbi:MAG: HAD family hydrolase [Anaerotignaceae bacterium]
MKAVIFDLDGTLIDSMWIWVKVDLDMLARFGYKPDAEYEKNISSLNYYQGIDYMIKRYNLPITHGEFEVELKKLAYKEYSNIKTLKKGGFELITQLKEKGYKLAVATSCIREFCEMVLENCGVLSYFDTIVCSDELNTNKENPLIYLHTAEKLNVQPKDCIVFEDLPLAAQSARNAGMQVVGVYDDFNREKQEILKKISNEYIGCFCEYSIK